MQFSKYSLMRDFTLQSYRSLIIAFQQSGYRFQTFEEMMTAPAEGKTVVMRHDVDELAWNALKMAQLEHALGIRATYFFRIVKQSNVPEVIKQIVGLGHEIGYHYEDMTICEGDTQKAIAHFEKQLAYFRQFYPVKTICMHGAPRSRFDGKELWKSFDYHDYGIIGEPYFDVDFSHVFYLTDTGRRWDGFNVSLRDKVPVYQDEWVRQGLVYHSTDDIIRAVENGNFPKHLMMTTHPQRWTDQRGEWLWEYLSQSAKNVVKRLMKRRS